MNKTWSNINHYGDVGKSNVLNDMCRAAQSSKRATGWWICATSLSLRTPPGGRSVGLYLWESHSPHIRCLQPTWPPFPRLCWTERDAPTLCLFLRILIKYSSLGEYLIVDGPWAKQVSNLMAYSTEWFWEKNPMTIQKGSGNLMKHNPK